MAGCLGAMRFSCSTSLAASSSFCCCNNSSATPARATTSLGRISRAFRYCATAASICPVAASSSDLKMWASRFFGAASSAASTRFKAAAGSRRNAFKRASASSASECLGRSSIAFANAARAWSGWRIVSRASPNAVSSSAFASGSLRSNPSNFATTLRDSPSASSVWANGGYTRWVGAPSDSARFSSISAPPGSPASSNAIPSSKRASARSGAFCSAFLSSMIAAACSPSSRWLFAFTTKASGDWFAHAESRMAAKNAAATLRPMALQWVISCFRRVADWRPHEERRLYVAACSALSGYGEGTDRRQRTHARRDNWPTAAYAKYTSPIRRKREASHQSSCGPARPRRRASDHFATNAGQSTTDLNNWLTTLPRHPNTSAPR